MNNEPMTYRASDDSDDEEYELLEDSKYPKSELIIHQLVRDYAYSFWYTPEETVQELAYEYRLKLEELSREELCAEYHSMYSTYYSTVLSNCVA